LIGIDKYQHYPPLVGAVKDVEDVFDFLLSSLSVPTSCITKLLDHEATADAIVNGIRSLAHHPDIKHGDAILVYFSGHGARAIAPQGWETSDGYVETICPVDISSDLTAKPLVSGIPDLMLNMLITQIAEKKGDNIVWSRFPTFRAPLAETSFFICARLSYSIAVILRTVCAANRSYQAFVE